MLVGNAADPSERRHLQLELQALLLLIALVGREPDQLAGAEVHDHLATARHDWEPVCSRELKGTG
jgi:hypothetical protein